MNQKRCRHCSLEIDYRADIETWVHVDTGSVYCGLSGMDVAEPNRWGGS